LEALATINAEFPLGIDLVLTDPAGRIACIPRSSRVRWEK
jgi:alpha-D-ribose 1-methylphosphonate 5-triphosphate synthase subunit PhnH